MGGMGAECVGMDKMDIDWHNCVAQGVIMYCHHQECCLNDLLRGMSQGSIAL